MTKMLNMELEDYKAVLIKDLKKQEQENGRQAVDPGLQKKNLRKGSMRRSLYQEERSWKLSKETS